MQFLTFPSLTGRSGHKMWRLTFATMGLQKNLSARIRKKAEIERKHAEY